MKWHRGQKLLIFSVCVFFIFGVYRASRTAFSNRLVRYADDIISHCSVKRPQQVSCYDYEIQSRTGLSLEEGFELAQLIRSKDSAYAHCHILGHALSEREVKKNSADWLGVFARCPTSICTAGCMHGAMQARFEREVFTDEQISEVIPVLSKACLKENPVHSRNSIDRYSCYHGVGHAVLYFTGANLRKAFLVCDALAKQSSQESYLETCLDGLFMRFYGPQDPEDLALVKDLLPQRDSIGQFCSSFTGPYYVACIKHGWVLWGEEILSSRGVERYCSQFPWQHQKVCYGQLAASLIDLFGMDITKIEPICAGLSYLWRGECFASAAMGTISTDDQLISHATSLCAKAQTYGVGEICYKRLVAEAMYAFDKAPSGESVLCKQLIEPWQTKCVTCNKMPTAEKIACIDK